MSSSASRPSIFTPRDALKPSHAAEPQRPPTRPPRTSSPFGRQRTPDAFERGLVQAAAEAAPLVIHLPENTAARAVNAGIGDGSAQNWSGIVKGTSVWDSFKSAQSRVEASPANHASKGRSASVSHLVTTAPSGASTSLLSPDSGGDQSKKRILEDIPEERVPNSEPIHKRPRLRPPLKHYLPGYRFNTSELKRGVEPPSPLFFSNSPQPRPSLPPRFSSSEAAARMLSKARTEDSHVKTVSLARGVVSSPGHNMSPPASAASRPSVERSTTGRSISPDPGEPGGSANVLGAIGILELLEHDERPTFILDLGDSAHYGSASLRPVFVNNALRCQNGLEAVVTGQASMDPVSPGSRSFAQFKSWALNPSSSNGEPSASSFAFANICWTSSTLRRRLRVIKGTLGHRVANERSSIEPDARNPARSAPAFHPEPADYFGPSALLADANNTSDSSTSGTRTVVSTIEDIHPSAAIRHDLQMGDAFLAPRDKDFSVSVELLPGAATYVSNYSGHAPSTSYGSEADEATSRIPMVPSDFPSFDWTRLPITDSMPPHIRFARSIDWAKTSLGPIDTWSSDLRQMCNLIMASPHPAAMYWGDDLISIYNEAYILLAGQKHPQLMGQSYRDAWAEIWPEIEPVFRNARQTGEATMKDDDCLFIRRSDYLEETYFSWSIIPMVGGDGTVMGLYNPAFEKTRRKIAERRMLTLREVGERTASARDVDSFWAQVLGSFEYNEYDSPFLLLYSVENESDSDGSSMHSNSVLASRTCTLEGALGVPEGHPAAPETIDLKAGQEGFGPVFREVMKTDKPVTLEVGSKDLPASLLQNLDFRGFGDPVNSVTVCPIHPTTGENILGFLVLGVNPRRPYDDDYVLFVQLLSRQLATSLASVVLFEEEIRRGQRAAKLAALDRIELSQQLAARTQEAIESETKFTRMAEFAPVGMFIADATGKITFANDTWYDISQVPKNRDLADTWMDYVMPADYDKVKKLWNDLVIGIQPVSAEFRFKAAWEDKHGQRDERWALFSGYPEKYEDGRLKSIFGSFTNISQQKWAEGIQTRKMEEAVELKRQQENFIDITSHEMRNPLSAILQCSDEIATSLTRFKNSGESNVPEELLSSCLDAAQIINLCSQHQKRIVDDILTLSKLDSQLLLVTPVDAQPLTVVQRAMKMHEGELQAADIQLKFVVDQSYRNLALDWVRFDPSRVLQVLINLTTNAIKFTGGENKRVITVTISASRTRPSEQPNAPVKYFPTRRQGKAMIDEKDWGDGEKVFVHFAVRDTGRGLNPEEKKMLFMRFSQASPRTHVQYGGSGLGLFISRELTELQGGEIGVESEAGKGSTFAFYVLARTSVAPPDSETGQPVSKPGLRSKSMPTHSVNVSKTQPLTASMASNGSSSATLQPPQSSPHRLKTLIVEDNLVNQRVLQKQLKNLGTEVHLANHGGEALEKIKQSTYWAANKGSAMQKLELGVVLMDQEMPIMDGLTTTRKIREMEKEGLLTGHVPIIAVTANARAEQVQDAILAGMDDVVSKPFRIPELVPKIEELMARYPPPPS